MTSKCSRKLTIVMMKLLIFILLKAQANDHGHISFPPYSSPFSLPHFSELDKVKTNNLALTFVSPSQLRIMYPRYSFELDKVEGTIHTCFAKAIGHCADAFSKLENRSKFKFCLAHRFDICRYQHFTNFHFSELRFSMLLEAKRCYSHCLQHETSRVVSCYLECIKNPPKKH
jgi:hypothetical protein